MQHPKISLTFSSLTSSVPALLHSLQAVEPSPISSLTSFMLVLPMEAQQFWCWEHVRTCWWQETACQQSVTTFYGMDSSCLQIPIKSIQPSSSDRDYLLHCLSLIYNKIKIMLSPYKSMVQIYTQSLWLALHPLSNEVYRITAHVF